MDDAYYIDTRPNAPGIFSPPAGVNDYAEWIKTQYDNSQIVNGESVQCWGVTQKINMMTQGQELSLFAIGPHAGAAASFVESVTGRTVEVLYER